MQMLGRTQPLLISRSLPLSLPLSKALQHVNGQQAEEGEESAPESAREYLQTRQEATCSDNRFTVTRS